MKKSYYLLKSEPDVWSIDQQKKAGKKGAAWDGVRNYQAAKNLRNMKKGDQCFFYHSNIGKEIVGIVEVIKEHYPKVKNNFNAVDSISLDTFSKCKDLSEHYVNIDEKKVSTINYNVFVNRILNFSKFYN